MKIETAYNRIVNSLGLEYLDLNKEEQKGWTKRDILSEIQYQLNRYYESGTTQNDMLEGHFGDDDKQIALKEIAKLKRFISKYKDEALKEKCFEKHHSCYD